MAAKRKVFLTKEQQQSVHAAVKIQLRAIDPVIEQPANRAQRKAIHRNPDLLKPKWYREITRHLSDEAIPHCRTGNKLFQKGRNDGFFHGGLLRDKDAAESQSILTNKTNWFRTRLSVRHINDSNKIYGKNAIVIAYARDRRSHKDAPHATKFADYIKAVTGPTIA